MNHKVVKSCPMVKKTIKRNFCIIRPCNFIMNSMSNSRMRLRMKIWNLAINGQSKCAWRRIYSELKKKYRNTSMKTKKCRRSWSRFHRKICRFMETGRSFQLWWNTQTSDSLYPLNASTSKEPSSLNLTLDTHIWAQNSLFQNLKKMD